MGSAEPAPQRFTNRYVTVPDGLRLHLRDYAGDQAKPPLLCLHGLTRNARDFDDYAERYAGDWRVLAVDFRGRGESDYDPMPMRYTPLTYAGDVLQVLDQLGVPEAIFVGTSLGGLVTMAIAAMASERVAAAVLNDVGPELSQDGLDRIRTYVGHDVRFPSWDAAADAFAANSRHLPASHTHADWLRAARRACRERDGEIVFDYDMAIVEPFNVKGATPAVDMWPLFHALGRKPLLVLRGELSDLLTAEAVARMREATPSAQFVTVPAVGHAPELNEREAVAAVDRFLAALPSRVEPSH